MRQRVDRWSTLYENDFARWAEEQEAAIREHRWADLDVKNLCDEIGDLSRSVRREVRSRLANLISHLLRRAYQPGRASRSWDVTVREQALQVNDLLHESPSLGPRMVELTEQAYRLGRLQAARETDLPLETFPDAMDAQIRAALDDALHDGERD
jgi:uncharacterized protein DUF29